MKKLYSLTLAASLLAGSLVVNAADYYPKYIINENFDELQAVPAGWSIITDAKKAVFNGNGGASIADKALKTNGSGSGNRGVDVTFSGVDTTVVKEQPVLYVEFDWTALALTIGNKNTYGFAFTGSDIITNSANWYTPAIFGLYMIGDDNAIHYWNMDPLGPEDTTTLAANPQWYGHMGPVYLGSATVNTNNRVGPASSNANVDSVNAYNASTRALVLPALTNTTVHVKAALDFTAQKVVSLTLTQADSAANTVTIENMPFLAPYMIGADTTVVAKEDRIVKDLSRLASVGTRSNANGLGNGVNSNFDIRTDNFQVYYLKESIGRRDISLNFKDQNGDQAKASIVYAQQEVGEELIIAAEELVSFSTEAAYYAFDAEATLAANATATSYKTMPVEAGSTEFNLIFKKYPKTAGSYAWTGAESKIWNQLDANFKVADVALGYQNGNSVELSDASKADTILVNETIEMGEGNLVIAAPGYTLSGYGMIQGTGKMIANEEATFAVTSKLPLEVAAGKSVNLNITTAAASIKAGKDAVLNINPEGTFSIPVEGEESITIVPLNCAKDLEYNMAITGIQEAKWELNNAGKLNGVRFEGTTNATYSAATDSTPVTVTVINKTDTMAGFGAITTTGLRYVDVNLDKNVRLVRYYNEGGTQETDYIGALNGLEGATLESGWVDGRGAYYRIGGLNTDAAFNGDIVPFKKNDSTYTTSKIDLIKEGTGAQILAGKLAFNGSIEVAGGSLDISKATILSSVASPCASKPDSTFATVITSVQVDSAATLILGAELPIEIFSSKSGSTVYSNNTVFPGDIQIGGAWFGGANSYSMGLVDATLNMTVNGFEEGQYDALICGSDITVIRTKLNITVVPSTAEDKVIKLFDGNIDMPEGPDSCLVFVNGKDITENTPETAGQGGFSFDFTTGELTINAGTVAINTVGKEIVRIESFDLLGKAAKMDAEGILVTKTYYNDGTVVVSKVINR